MFAIKVMDDKGGYAVFAADRYLVAREGDKLFIETENDETDVAQRVPVHSVAYIMNSAGSTIDVVRAKAREAGVPGFSVGDSGPEIAPLVKYTKDVSAAF